MNRGARSAWHIDADDTKFDLEIADICKLLKKAEEIASQQSIDIFSLDMHSTYTKNEHWSFGIAYISNNVAPRVLHSGILNQDNYEWYSPYEDGPDRPLNLDWYFTYLRDNRILNLKTFYPDHVFFEHGFKHFEFSNTKYRFPYNFSFWNEGYLEFPIFLDSIFGARNPSKYKLTIPGDLIKIDVVDRDSSWVFIQNYFLGIY